MKEAPEFWSGWRDRLSALRNVPTVLHYVWESGRSVVVAGLLARVVAALLPARWTRTLWPGWAWAIPALSMIACVYLTLPWFRL